MQGKEKDGERAKKQNILTKECRRNGGDVRRCTKGGEDEEAPEGKRVVDDTAAGTGDKYAFVDMSHTRSQISTPDLDPSAALSWST